MRETAPRVFACPSVFHPAGMVLSKKGVTASAADNGSEIYINARYKLLKI